MIYRIHIIIVVIMAYIFYFRWLPSGKLAWISGMLHMSVRMFLFLVVLILCAIAISTIDNVLWNILSIFKYAINHKLNLSDTANKYFIVILMFILQYVSLQFSSLESFAGVCEPGVGNVLLNIAVIMTLNIIVLLIVQQWKISLILTSVFVSVWSIANYYVIVFHGSPLYISELNNMKTAFEVASTYTYNISFPVIFSIIVLCTEIIYTYKYLNLEHKKTFITRILVRCIGSCICIVCICLAMTNLWGAKNTWSWKNSISKYGFMVCVLSDVKSLVNPFSMPEGYDADLLKTMENEGNISDKNDFPDIIMILNESFCDLNYIAEISTDENCLEDFYSIPNATYGYAVTPSTGGGTNNSEFELLFSKSLRLMNIDAPFTYLSPTLEERSAIQYLNSLGYTTTAMHCGQAENYSRNIAYPAMEFDNIILGPDAYTDTTSNGNRIWTDEGNYNDLINYYEDAGDEPQFIYLLTYQNHGGYEQNNESLDTVHVVEDLGELTNDVNEYLTSVQLSAEAFVKLTEYYDNVDRDVIICMVGDHAPSFVSDLPSKNEAIIDDTSINQRMVPYVIWSNYDMTISHYTDYASMVDLMPMVLESADIPLSTFYNHILDLHEVLPIRTREGIGVNREFEMESYSEECEFYDLWSKYYYLEYNSLVDEEEYLESLFVYFGR